MTNSQTTWCNNGIFFWQDSLQSHGIITHSRTCTSQVTPSSAFPGKAASMVRVVCGTLSVYWKAATDPHHFSLRATALGHVLLLLITKRAVMGQRFWTGESQGHSTHRNNLSGTDHLLQRTCQHNSLSTLLLPTSVARLCLSGCDYCECICRTKQTSHAIKATWFWTMTTCMETSSLPAKTENVHWPDKRR